MSCGCNKTNLQGTQYCQECMPDEVTWLVPTNGEPDPFFMDRHHAYIMPNNTIYVLSHDRTQAIDISGVDDLRDKVTALEGKADADTKYTAGAGLLLNKNNMFSLKADSYAMGLGFTYTNPFITIGFINQGQEDADTGTVTHTVRFSGINGAMFKNTLVVNPTNLVFYRHSNQIKVSSGNATFSFPSLGSETYYTSATRGRVLIITEVIS